MDWLALAGASPGHCDAIVSRLQALQALKSSESDSKESSQNSSSARIQLANKYYAADVPVQVACAGHCFGCDVCASRPEAELGGCAAFCWVFDATRPLSFAGFFKSKFPDAMGLLVDSETRKSLDLLNAEHSGDRKTGAQKGGVGQTTKKTVETDEGSVKECKDTEWQVQGTPELCMFVAVHPARSGKDSLSDTRQAGEHTDTAPSAGESKQGGGWLELAQECAAGVGFELVHVRLDTSLQSVLEGGTDRWAGQSDVARVLEALECVRWPQRKDKPRPKRSMNQFKAFMDQMKLQKGGGGGVSVGASGSGGGGGGGNGLLQGFGASSSSITVGELSTSDTLNEGSTTVFAGKSIDAPSDEPVVTDKPTDTDKKVSDKSTDKPTDNDKPTDTDKSPDTDKPTDTRKGSEGKQDQPSQNASFFRTEPPSQEEVEIESLGTLMQQIRAIRAQAAFRSDAERRQAAADMAMKLAMMFELDKSDSDSEQES